MKARTMSRNASCSWVKISRCICFALHDDRTRGGDDPREPKGRPPASRRARRRLGSREPKGAALPGLTSEARREGSASRAPGGEWGKYSVKPRLVRHKKKEPQRSAAGTYGTAGEITRP